jgi:hypothetical protein
VQFASFATFTLRVLATNQSTNKQKNTHKQTNKLHKQACNLHLQHLAQKRRKASQARIPKTQRAVQFWLGQTWGCWVLFQIVRNTLFFFARIWQGHWATHAFVENTKGTAPAHISEKKGVLRLRVC